MGIIRGMNLLADGSKVQLLPFGARGPRFNLNSCHENSVEFDE